MEMLLTRARLMLISFGTDDSIQFGRRYLNIYSKGVHARYRRLTTKWGMKFYASSTQRDMVRKAHQELFDAGLGPELGPDFDFECRMVGKKNEPAMVYGFIIEHVPLITKDIGANKYTERMEALYKMKNRVWHEFPEYYNDLHSENTGFMSDDRPVVVDAGYLDDPDTGSVFRFHKLDSDGRILTDLTKQW